jgi:hypothetical protein
MATRCLRSPACPRSTAAAEPFTRTRTSKRVPASILVAAARIAVTTTAHGCTPSVSTRRCLMIIDEDPYTAHQVVQLDAIKAWAYRYRVSPRQGGEPSLGSAVTQGPVAEQTCCGADPRAERLRQKSDCAMAAHSSYPSPARQPGPRRLGCGAWIRCCRWPTVSLRTRCARGILTSAGWLCAWRCRACMKRWAQAFHAAARSDRIADA